MKLAEKERLVKIKSSEFSREYADLTPEVTIERWKMFEDSFFAEIEYEIQSEFQRAHNMRIMEAKEILEPSFKLLRKQEFQRKTHYPTVKKEVSNELGDIINTLQRIYIVLRNRLHQSTEARNIVYALDDAIHKLENYNNRNNQTTQTPDISEIKSICNDYSDFIIHKLNKYKEQVDLIEMIDESARRKDQNSNTGIGSGTETDENRSKDELFINRSDKQESITEAITNANKKLDHITGLASGEGYIEKDDF